MARGGILLRKIRAKIADEPTGFVWVESGKLAASGYPASERQVRWLSLQKVGSILSLTEQPLPEAWLAGTRLVTHHVPLGDHKAPSPESLSKAVGIIDQEIGSGRPVVVHCLAGQGRTGCVLAAYLIHSRKIGAEQSIAELRKLKPEFVEPSQEGSLFEFARREGL